MTVALCTAGTGPHAELLDICRPNLEKYAARWDFDLYHAPPINTPRPMSWLKIIRLSNLLNNGYDTAVWVDADTLIVDMERNILDAATTERPLWMVAHRYPGLDHPLLNCGVLVAHKNPRLSQFFNLVYSQTQYLDHPWWEQAAVCHLLGWTVDPPGGVAHPGEDTEWTDLVGLLGTEWNSMRYDPHPNPVIKHYTGAGIAHRAQEMRGDL